MVKAEFFCVDGGLVASKDSGWIQSVFYTLTGIFNRVRKRTDIRKTVGMLCKPCQSSRVWADKAYTQRMMEEGRSFKERQQ